MLRRGSLCISLLALAILTAAAAETATLPFVSPVFGDHMVLQRGKPNPIWGWSKPGETIRVTIGHRSKKTLAAADGRWQVAIEPPATDGPCTVIVDGSQHVELQDVLVGDMWLCGGQSNMELGLGLARNGDEEIKSADHPQMRLFMVSHHVSYSPAAVPEGSWKVCSPQTIGEGGWNGFSAVAYYFGRKLQNDLHVPIGLIEDCWGGTPAESWMCAPTLRKLREFDLELNEIERLRARGGPQLGSFLMHWLAEYDIGESNHWSAADFDDAHWKPVQIPGGFSELGLADAPGICWFRKEITLPDPLPAGKATLHLGVVDKMDTAFVNGHWVGASSWVENPRAYLIADGILKPGKNILAVRVFKNKPAGGFLSKAEDLNVTLGDQTKIPLAGEWNGALSLDARPPHPLPLSYENYPTMPAVLNEGMIAPVAPLAITGAIWYQGEANAERAFQYRTLLPAMIADWRTQFGQGDFPFYIVGLPAFMPHQNHPTESSWAELREAQALTARSVPHCALAVTIDTGETDNIHPKDKQPVGERLALCALAEHYGEKIPFQGPTFKSVETLSGALKIRFDHTAGGLVVKGDKLEEFSVAGADHQWHWADAKLAGDAVIVSSPQVSQPIAVRYAWQSNPKATLFNGAGLPAGPFRSDNWLEITEKKKQN